MPDAPKGNPDRFLDWGLHGQPADEAGTEVGPHPDSMAGRGELKAPHAGWFRVVGVDTFEASDADFHIGDFADRGEAIAEATARAGVMCPVYVYDERGELIFNAGEP